MKLSEAIRLNGVMKPQGVGVGSLLSLDAPCALGGALQAIGKRPKDGRAAVYAIRDAWRFIFKPANCPCGNRSNHFEFPCTIFTVIILLNDEHRWTRNQIAAWVATVEPAEPTPDEKAVPVEWKLAA